MPSPATHATLDDDTVIITTRTWDTARRIVQALCLRQPVFEMTAEWYLARPLRRYSTPLVVIIGQRLLELAEVRADGRIGRCSALVFIGPDLVIAPSPARIPDCQPGVYAE